MRYISVWGMIRKCQHQESEVEYVCVCVCVCLSVTCMNIVCHMRWIMFRFIYLFFIAETRRFQAYTYYMCSVFLYRVEFAKENLSSY